MFAIAPVAGCKAPLSLSVVSSKKSDDAKFESGALVAGEVVELWQNKQCGERVRYLFRFGPGKGGELKMIGFERTR